MTSRNENKRRIYRVGDVSKNNIVLGIGKNWGLERFVVIENKVIAFALMGVALIGMGCCIGSVFLNGLK